MNDHAGKNREGALLAALLPLFFVSGAAALAYQLVWQRELQRVFGTSTFAVSTLLAAFMAGLAIGGLAIAHRADRLRRPLVTYAALEFAIGLYALALPRLIEIATPLYLGTWRAVAPGPVVFGLLQSGLVFVLLLPPTAAMGATLPLLARLAARQPGTIASRVGWLYAANTLGAVAGTALCGFVLLPRLGVRTTTLLAVAANGVLALVALGLARRRPAAADRAPPVAHGAVVADRALQVVAATAIALAGIAALVYEVAWTRLLALMLGSSAYTFAVMLIAFLGGIGLGGWMGGPVADGLQAKHGRAGVLLGFAALEVAVAVLACATMFLYAELPFWYVSLFDRLGGAAEPSAGWWVSLLLAGLVMTPPAILMGMHFPLAVRAVAGDGRLPGRAVAVIYSANAGGGALGAFAAGFLLLPAIGMQGTVLVAAAVGLGAAVLLAVFAVAGERPRRALLLPLAAVVLMVAFVARRPAWDPLLMTAGMYHYVAKFDDHSRAGVRRYSVDLYDLVSYEEGLSGVVTVARDRGSPHQWLAINGKVDASTNDDLPTQVLIGLLPMQFVASPTDVLVIGLASGVTAGSVSLVPGVEALEIVEIEPAIGRAAAWFEAWNHAVLDDPRVRLVHNDGRNHLLLAGRESYDLVISEPSNPWISGVANLFTREFLELGKERLKPGGVWSQWVPIYGMGTDDLRSVLRTFADVYPHVAVFSTIEYNDLVLLGSDSSLVADESGAERLLRVPAVAGELARIDIRTAPGLLSLYLGDRDAIGAMAAGAIPNTDDNLLIEYSTSRKLHVDTRPENHAMLSAHARVPAQAFDQDDDGWRRLAEIYRRRGDAERAAAAMARARQLSSAPAEPRPAGARPE